jgi:hypothetical protein
VASSSGVITGGSNVKFTFGLFAFVSTFLFNLIVSPIASAVPSNGKYFDRVVTVMFENTNYATAIKQPFFASLATTGANFTNFVAETHPSQANYIALTAGTMGPVKGDGNYNLDLTNVVDLLEAHGISWKVYAEGYPGNCFTGTTNSRYARKHNPFISFKDIQDDPARCAKIVDASEFDTDLASGNLPAYVFYIPDLDNDGHDTGAAFADNWYKAKFGPVVADASVMKNTILLSTFDESGAGAKNLVYTTIVGPGVKPGDYADQVSHYSLLRLVEDNWALGTLGRIDGTAPVMPLIWK